MNQLTPHEEMGNTLPTTRLQTSSQKSEQITHLVHQCFAIQDTYGKSPEQLKILMKAMVIDLQEYPSSMIDFAFKEWRRTQAKIPTPADILNLIRTEQRHQMRMAELSSPNQNDEEINAYKNMNQKERDDLDDFMRGVRKTLGVNG